MDAQEKYEYWLDIAMYDLETAETMLQGERWLYVVFMCQQAIEKLVKGLYVLYVDDNVPKTHNIRVLVEKIERLLPEVVTDEHYDLFEDLTIHYLNGRYADYKSKLSERLNGQIAVDFLSRTKEAFAWLLTLKP
jgi:HEPN domain-containing protein